MIDIFVFKLLFERLDMKKAPCEGAFFMQGK